MALKSTSFVLCINSINANLNIRDRIFSPGLPGMVVCLFCVLPVLCVLKKKKKKNIYIYFLLFEATARAAETKEGQQVRGARPAVLCLKCSPPSSSLNKVDDVMGGWGGGVRWFCLAVMALGWQADGRRFESALAPLSLQKL